MPNPPFPTFNNGVVSGIDGYGESDLLYSTVEALDSGYGNAYAWNSYIDADGVFHNFQEERFSIAFPMFTQTEVATLENFFASMAGPYGYFTFTDDQGIIWPQCQFDQETLEFQYLGPNQYSVECKILAVTQAPIPPRPLPNPGPPPGPTGKTLKSGVISVWTAYVNTSGFSVFAGVTGDQGGLNWSPGWGPFDLQKIVKTDVPYGLRLDTFTLIPAFPGDPNANAVNDIQNINATKDCTVSFFLSNNNGAVDPANGIELHIYDCYMAVVYTDGSTATVRPTQYRVVVQNNVNGFGFIDANPGNAFDADSTPPTTFTVWTRNSLDSLNFINSFQLFGFPMEL